MDRYVKKYSSKEVVSLLRSVFSEDYVHLGSRETVEAIIDDNELGYEEFIDGELYFSNVSCKTMAIYSENGRGYGFVNGVFSNEISMVYREYWMLGGEEERKSYESKLKEEAISLGFCKGVKFPSAYDGEVHLSEEGVIEINWPYAGKPSVFFDGVFIMRNGEWSRPQLGKREIVVDGITYVEK